MSVVFAGLGAGIDAVQVMIDHERKLLRLIDWGLAEFYHPNKECARRLPLLRPPTHTTAVTSPVAGTWCLPTQAVICQVICQRVLSSGI